MTLRHLITAALAVAGLSACSTAPVDTTTRAAVPLVTSPAESPPGAAPGTCWGKISGPSVIKTVSRTVLVAPAQVSSDGRIQKTARYRTETSQDIIEAPEAQWFRTPCSKDLTPQSIAALQRALSARGVYKGPPSGNMDRQTREAIRAYQTPQGLNSSVISVISLRQLGLWTIDRAETDG